MAHTFVIPQIETAAASFGDDVAFMQRHTEIVVLSDPSGKAKVAVAPAYQGRIMTSSAEGDSGLSFGWINRERIAARDFIPHMNAFGGEDRFWLGPEGGQFSIFFTKAAPFDLDHWFTPAPIDTEPFQLMERTAGEAVFRRAFTVTNYSGTIFDVRVDRHVRLLPAADAWEKLGTAGASGIKMTAFESINRLSNTGTQPWRKETGLLSIWILGMFTPSPATTVVIPIREGSETELGSPVNADYFGTVPPERLAVKGGLIFFNADGKHRGKIGINPRRARPLLASYDAAHQVLTLVQYTLPAGATNYVNSMWEIQEHPYSGDAANSYNDGPPSPGAKPLGPFYELESSSPAAELGPSQTLEHVHRTFHLRGSKKQLEPVARALLGIGLDEIETALPR